MILALAAAVGTAPALPSAAGALAFDLSRAPTPPAAVYDSAPIPPRKLDPRDLAVEMPELVVPLAENGPRLLVGAFGGRGKGMPKLVHVGMGWTF